jgi:hypothetical protein
VHHSQLLLVLVVQVHQQLFIHHYRLLQRQTASIQYFHRSLPRVAVLAVQEHRD